MVSVGVKAVLSPSVRASSSLLGLDIPRGGVEPLTPGAGAGTLPTLSPRSQGAGGFTGVQLLTDRTRAECGFTVGNHAAEVSTAVVRRDGVTRPDVM